MSSYTPYYPTWEDEPDTDTPIVAAALNHMEAGIVAANAPGGAIEYENAWAAGTAYTAGDVVRHNGVDYLAVNPSTGQIPGVAALGGFGTALPGSPVDGQEFTLVDSLTAPTYAWRLRYVAAKATNKWVFIGGSALASYVTASESLGVSSYTDLATYGPSVTVPVAGDYIIRLGAWVYHGQTCESWMSYTIGATAPVDQDGFHKNAAAGSEFNEFHERRKTFAAGTALVAKYKCNWSVAWAYRFLSVQPVAVGG